MDFDKATLVKSGPEEVASCRLYTKDGLSCGCAEVDNAVGETSSIGDHVLAGTFILVRIVVNAQLGFLY